MQRYRDDKISIDMFEFRNWLGVDQVFPRIDKWLVIPLQNDVKDIVYGYPYSLARSYPFPTIKVLAAKSLRELDLSGCDLMDVSLSSGAVHFHSLRKLSLSRVSLDENILQTLLKSYPLIFSFILEHYSGLGKIELLNLQKIKSIFITETENKCFKIHAPTLENLFYSSWVYSSENFDVVECQNLKSLELNNVRIFDGFLHNLISRSQSLEALKIRNFWGIRDIDYSNLVKNEYIGHQIPELKMASQAN
ncbi:hypothetical protein BC332_31057 [Capsicum chinense]|nr:hypothetical protein BC332_31057 [Capsicum chinense]